MRITWKIEPRETGVTRVLEGQRGYIISVDGKQVGRAAPLLEDGWHPIKETVGYYWHAKSEQIPPRDTSDAPVPTIEAAKAACEAYVRKCLGMTEKKGR